VYDRDRERERETVHQNVRERVEMAASEGGRRYRRSRCNIRVRYYILYYTRNIHKYIMLVRICIYTRRFGALTANAVRRVVVGGYTRADGL